MSTTTTERHGTVGGYTNDGCRCVECTRAMREYNQRRMYGAGGPAPVDRKALSDLLNELFPDGLTDDCPAARAKANQDLIDAIRRWGRPPRMLEWPCARAGYPSASMVLRAFGHQRGA